jgi:hypothetical protein
LIQHAPHLTSDALEQAEVFGHQVSGNDRDENVGITPLA